MKSFSLNHAKLVFVDSRHNSFHWLVVVAIKTALSLALFPLGIYLAAIGFLLSERITKLILPTGLQNKINFYTTLLPCFSLIKKSLLDRLGHWYQDAPSWWTLIVGIPLVLMGTSVFLINLFGLLHSIFSPDYNRTHCPFCKEPIKLKARP